MSSKISKTLTIGLELETSRSSAMAERIMREQGFTSHYDSTITGDRGENLSRSGSGCAMEIISQPYPVQVSHWYDGSHHTANYGSLIEQIKALCDCATSCNKSCGFHVHIGLPNPDGKSKWNPEQIRTTLIIGLLLEKKLYALCPDSRRTSRFCHPLLWNPTDPEGTDEGGFYTPKDMAAYYPTGVVLANKSENKKRYCWLNLVETRRPNPLSPTIHNTNATGTVEIRMLGHTSRPAYVTPWVKLWVHIMGLISSVPSTMAIQHAVFADTLDLEFAQLQMQREEAVQAAHLRTPSPYTVEDGLPDAVEHPTPVGTHPIHRTRAGLEHRTSDGTLAEAHTSAAQVVRGVTGEMTPGDNIPPSAVPVLRRIAGHELALPIRRRGRPSNADRAARIALINSMAENSAAFSTALPSVATRQPGESLAEYQTRLSTPVVDAATTAEITR